MKDFLYWMFLSTVFTIASFVTLFILRFPLPLKLILFLISIGMLVYCCVNLGKATAFLKFNLKKEILKEVVDKPNKK